MSQKSVKRERKALRAAWESEDAFRERQWLGLMRERGWPEVSRAEFLGAHGLLTPIAMAVENEELIERITGQRDGDMRWLSGQLAESLTPPAPSSRAYNALLQKTLDEMVQRGDSVHGVSDDDYVFLGQTESADVTQQFNADSIALAQQHRKAPPGVMFGISRDTAQRWNP